MSQQARIVALADVFDALTHDRPYKPAWSLGNALQEIDARLGSQFDPQIVEAFRRISAQQLDGVLKTGLSAHLYLIA